MKRPDVAPGRLVQIPSLDTSRWRSARFGIPRKELALTDEELRFKLRPRLTGQDAIDLKLCRPRECFGRDVQA